MPKNATRQLKTNATMPLASKPVGKGPGGAGAPVKSRKSLVLPAALPAMGESKARQAS